MGFLATLPTQGQLLVPCYCVRAPGANPNLGTSTLQKTVCEATPICARQAEEIGRQMWGTVGEPSQRAKAISPRKQTCHFAPGFSIPSHLAADFGQHLFPADLGAYIRDAVTVAARLR